MDYGQKRRMKLEHYSRSKEVKEPVHVRFGWDQLATPNLFNKAGLPASPFTTEK